MTGIAAKIIVVVIANPGGDKKVIGKITQVFQVVAVIIATDAIIARLLVVDANNQIESRQIGRTAEVLPAPVFAICGKGGNTQGEVFPVGFCIREGQVVGEVI